MNAKAVRLLMGAAENIGIAASIAKAFKTPHYVYAVKPVPTGEVRIDTSTRTIWSSKPTAAEMLADWHSPCMTWEAELICTVNPDGCIDLAQLAEVAA